jgi:hypothetical protein
MHSRSKKAYGFEKGNVGSMPFKKAHEERNREPGSPTNKQNSGYAYLLVCAQGRMRGWVRGLISDFVSLSAIVTGS